MWSGGQTQVANETGRPWTVECGEREKFMFSWLFTNKRPTIIIVDIIDRAGWLLPWSERHGREQRVAESPYTGSSLGDLPPPWLLLRVYIVNRTKRCW